MDRQLGGKRQQVTIARHEHGTLGGGECEQVVVPWIRRRWVAGGA
jgi:hypothetical protein